MGEIHLTREVTDRLIHGALSRDERQVPLEHLNGGPCEQCDAAAGDPDDDTQFRALLDCYVRLRSNVLRCLAEAGDPAAMADLHEFRFQAIMRVVREKK